MKKQTVAILLFIALAISGYLVYYFFFKSDPIESGTGKDDYVSTENHDFVLDTEYKGDNQWEYTVTGTLPNSCYQVIIEGTVMESYPEQVDIQVKISKLQTFAACSEAIVEVEETDTFQASENAQVSLSVKRNY